jgi:Xaa-Pro dipeptidase
MEGQNMNVTALVEAVRNSGFDAWAMFDFRHSNAAAWTVLSLAPDAHCTRRWMVVVRADGQVFKLVHSMEQLPLQHVKANTIEYVTRSQWHEGVTRALAGCTTIAMEYSPLGALPAVSCVDAGTIECIRSLGCHVVSAEDLAQHFTAVLSQQQIDENLATAKALRRCVMAAFDLVRSTLQAGNTVTEYAVQQALLSFLQRENLRTDSPPIVAIGVNAASPHYAPTALQTSVIEPGMTVLIDSWARGMNDDSVYADITWVGYTGDVVPTDVADRFDVLVRARDAAVRLCQQRFAEGMPVYGYELDDACRDVVVQAGLGHLFIHRTGHNISTVVHGPGANIDNFETCDTRRILPGTSFSIEPGAYEPSILGLRTELDVVIWKDGAVVVSSEPIQTHILPLLAVESPILL